MPLSAGDRLGRYEILEPLGAGGMGEVYRARDTELERDVAIKVLPETVARDPERLARFEGEAKAVASVAHPNILEIWDFGHEGEISFAVTELLEGENLRHRIPSGGMGWQRAAEIGAAIADGLAAAHGKGIIHRDLKPENVFLTSDGRVKILDFGLARHEPAGHEDGATHAPTLTRHTGPGTVLGTVGYMSPEQVRGEAVDGRSDIFSLGCVLYEMLSGTRAFARDTAVETMNAILKEEPSDLRPLVGDLPPSLAGIVRRCLEKPAQARFQTGQDLAFALRSALQGDSGPITRAVSGEKSIVVLPFENLSPDPEQDYFADGLTEEVVSDLARVRALRVISRTSAMQLKGTDKDVRTIGRELGVGYVLEGSVRRAGNALRITAQLIDTATDSHLWAEKYSGTLDDVFEMQEQLSRRIVDALEIELSPQEDRRMAERPIDDVQAYEWYLRAREQILRFSEAGYNRALSLIQSAMEITGENELLYATMGHVFAEQVLWGYELDPAYLDKVQRCVDKIFALNPGSAYGHSLQAMISYRHGNRAAAAALFKRALEDNPGDADALLWLVSVYVRAGHAAPARPLLARLLEIDPLTAANHLWIGWLDLCDHGDTRALARAAEIMYEKDPESPYSRWELAWALAADGRADEAHPVFDLLIRESPDTGFGRSARLFQAALRGDRTAASEAMTAELVSWASNDDVGAFWVAFCHALLGDVEGALRWLEIAMQRGWVNYPAHVAMPFFDGIRDDPRVKELTKKLQTAWQAFEA